jgi:dTMP kinase
MPFVTFEGIEGCGKSTQARRSSDYLREKGLDVLLVREPGGTKIGESIRSIVLDPSHTGLDPLAELLLIEASRRQHVVEVLAPAAARRTWILCDRFSDATSAYQGSGRGLSPEVIATIDRWSVGTLTIDRTFLFDCEVRVGLARARGRDGERSARFEGESLAFHERVRNGYLGLARREPARFVVLDANRPADTIFRDLATHLDSLISAQCPPSS